MSDSVIPGVGHWTFIHPSVLYKYRYCEKKEMTRMTKMTRKVKEWKMNGNVHDSCNLCQNKCKKLTRTVGCIGKRVIVAMAVTSLGQGRCQTACEQQRRRIEEDHLG
jgi:hypothetical protein